GGEVVAEGTPEEVMRMTDRSLTAQYLTGFKQIEVPRERRKGHRGQKIRIKGASAHNLHDVDAELPLGTFTCVTGVSGSGKSTLIIE
ncbi:MAG: hypothetical protein GWM88_18705, partial [Pseudomonadales bacterium]|nr:hypothetical protein [Pseudomonadales bacterium]NIS41697.1 hypothetical protein [Desulfuromonadales bacterium]NIX09956.1 hypothetical protein [Pseudomonadales bacterium]